MRQLRAFLPRPKVVWSAVPMMIVGLVTVAVAMVSPAVLEVLAFFVGVLGAWREVWNLLRRSGSDRADRPMEDSRHAE
jgi:hypothetical protein